MTLESARCLSVGRQHSTLATLILVRFLSMMDFVIVMPLAPQLMQRFSITPLQFSMLVSIYSIGAAVGGVLGAFVVDRFDRRRALLTLLLGFTVATLVCGIAPSFLVLLAGRMVAGMCGGNLEALSLTIIGDGFPEDRRAGATGKTMAGVALAMVVGVPGGLALAARFDWHMPFLLVAALAAIVLVAGCFALRPMTAHRLEQASQNAWHGVGELLRYRAHRHALACTVLLMFATFSILPYTATYYVLNLGVTNEQLPLIYLVGGSCSVLCAPLLGALADRHGQRRVFSIVALAAVVPMLVITHLPPVPIGIVILFATLMMVTRSGYYSVAEAIITSSAHPAYRGRFMSLDNACEQVSVGATMALTGLLIGTAPDGRLTGFGAVGMLGVAVFLLAIVLVRRLPDVAQGSDGGEAGSRVSVSVQRPT